MTIALDAAQQSEVKVGDKVTITLPNNQTTPGVDFLGGHGGHDRPSDRGRKLADHHRAGHTRPTRPPPADVGPGAGRR